MTRARESKPTRRRPGVSRHGARNETAAKKRAPRRTKKRVRRRVPLWRRAARAIPAFLALMVVAWVGLFYFFAPDLPTEEELWRDARRPALVFVAADGATVIGRRGGPETLTLDQLPSYVPNAVIAIEDRRFHSHFGFDAIGFARAVLANVQAGRVVQGGSTITQQLAKNQFLTPERSVTRKIQELILAVWLEARLDKDEILALYLNSVYLGAGAHGVDAAARRYFGKSAKALRLAEAAVIAGLLKAPSRLAPTRDLEAAKGRGALVLTSMKDAGFLDAPALERAMRELAELRIADRDGAPGFFVDQAAAEVEAFLSEEEARALERGEAGRDLWVLTTYRPEAQAAVEAAVDRVFERELRPGSDLEAAAVVLGRDGGVQAMVGGRSWVPGGFNRASAARRQPGSAFKPIVWAAALERGFIARSPMRDAPVDYDGWRPRNADGRYRGEVTLETALALSLNTVAAQLVELLGPHSVIDQAQKFGVLSPLNEVRALALGVSEVGLLELTGAYAPFAFAGRGPRPHLVTKIQFADGGRVVHQRDGGAGPALLAPDDAAQMAAMLRTAVSQGTGRAAAMPERYAAGKTGTSQNQRDAWFVGFTEDRLAGVWVGFDDNRPMRGVTGGGLPAKIWRETMEALPPAPGARPPALPAPPPATVAARAPAGERLADNAAEALGDWVGERARDVLGRLFEW